MSIEHLITRDVEEIYTPSTIYGIGGGGKEAVLQIFEQDWFAIEVMRSQNGTTNVYLVDTTVNEGNINDRITTRQEELNEIRDEMRELLSDQKIGGINIESVEITRDIKTDSPAALTGEGSVPDIKNTTNIDEWWLEHQDLIEPGTNDLYDFSKGACRCRAIGKAFHYKALAEARGTGYELNFTLPGDEDKVAIFVGLGGGTGSGVFMDIAKRLYEQNEALRTTLFATLPTRKEQIKERANAFAALSEIEYQTFTEEADIFDNVLLFPLQPLNPDLAVKDKQLLELDRAMAYAVIGYYNAGQYDDAVNQSPSYAPFTIALPQVFRYDIEGIIEARQNAVETINRKITTINAELELYEEIIEFLESNYDLPADGDLRRDDEDLLRRRIQFMRQLVELPLFEELEFDEARETGTKLLNTVYNADEIDGETYADRSLDVVFAEQDLDEIFLRELGFHFEYEYQDIDVGSELERIEELDENHIKRVILAESARLKHKYETLKSVRQIPSQDRGDESVSKLLHFLLDPRSDTDEAARVGAVQKHRDDIREQIEQKQSALSEVSNEIEQELSVQQNLVEDQINRWESAVSGDLTAYAELKAIDIEDDVEALTNALETFAKQIRQNRHPPTGENIEQRLDAIREKLDPVDRLNFENEYDRILTEVDQAIQLRQDWNTYLQARDRSLTQRLNPLSDAPDENSAKKVVRQSIVDLSDRVFSTSHLDVNQVELDFTVTYDPYAEGAILDEIRTTRAELERAIVEEFERRLQQIAQEEGDGNYQPHVVDRFRGRLESIESPDDLKRERDALLSYVRETYKTTASEDLPELEERKEALEDEIETLESTERKYEEVLELYKDLRDEYQKFVSKHEAFNRDINRQAERFGSHAFAEYQPNQHYIHKYMPQDTRRAIEKPSIAETDLFQADWEQNERGRIQDFTSEVVSRRVSAPNYVGLRKRKFGNNDFTFDGTRIHVAKISEALDSSGSDQAQLWIGDLDVEEKLNDNYNLDEAGEGVQMYRQWTNENGGPWDVAMTFFIQGLGFLDNLRDVVEKRGYRDGYEARQREIHNIALHHSYGLDEGFYAIRREFLDPKQPSEREHYLDTDATTIRHTLTRCLERVPISDEIDITPGVPEPVTYGRNHPNATEQRGESGSGRESDADDPTRGETKQEMEGDTEPRVEHSDHSSVDVRSVESEESEQTSEQRSANGGVEDLTDVSDDGSDPHELTTESGEKDAIDDQKQAEDR